MGQSIVAALPRLLKHSALFEAMLGSQSNDLLEAIFEVDMELLQPPTESGDLSDADNEGHLLHSYASRETFHRDTPYEMPSAAGGAGDQTPVRARRTAVSLTPQGGTSPLKNSIALPGIGERARSASRPRDLSLNADILRGPSDSGSPLARLFARRPDALTDRQVDIVSRRLEQVADGLKDLQVHRIKDDLKELQARNSFFSHSRFLTIRCL